jgi:hypothetical protein
MHNWLLVVVAGVGIGCGGGMGTGEPGGVIEPGAPDGGGNTSLVLGGAAIEGSIDDRDMDVTSFSPDFPEYRGDQYRITLAGAGPFKVGVKAVNLEERSNIIDYIIEAAPDGDASRATGHNAAPLGMNECRTFNEGNWTIRVVTFGSLPTMEDLATGTSRYEIKAEMAEICTY